jgi:DNA-binding NarL/FixJ family response regulator
MQETESRLRTLVVEDHRIFLSALTQAMSLDNSIEVVGSCNSPEEAIARIKEVPVDVIITDLEWRADPQGGIKLIHTALALSPEIKVLVCSAHDDEQAIRQAIQAGARGYLLKDEVDAVDVVEAVKIVQNDKPVFSDTVIQTMTCMLREASEGAPAVHPLETLTKRERDIVPQLIDGLSNAEIAECLGVAEKTVKTHVSHILQKLDLSSRHQVAGYAKQKRGQQEIRPDVHPRLRPLADRLASPA